MAFALQYNILYNLISVVSRIVVLFVQFVVRLRWLACSDIRQSNVMFKSEGLIHLIVA